MKVIFNKAQAAAPCPCQGPRPEVRCECGALVARLAGHRVELKCRRCKRVAYLDLEQLRRGGWVST